jgi:hypothetical protein
MTRIADLITPYNFLHNVFEILLLILSLGTTWWRFMPSYGTSAAKNISGPRTFSLDLLEGCKNAESTQFVLSHMAGSLLPQGNAYTMRYFPFSSSTSAWHSYLAHSVVSKVSCYSNSFVYCAISFSPRVFSKLVRYKFIMSSMLTLDHPE